MYGVVGGVRGGKVCGVHGLNGVGGRSPENTKIPGDTAQQQNSAHIFKGCQGVRAAANPAHRPGQTRDEILSSPDRVASRQQPCLPNVLIRYLPTEILT